VKTDQTHPVRQTQTIDRSVQPVFVSGLRSVSRVLGSLCGVYKFADASTPISQALDEHTQNHFSQTLESYQGSLVLLAMSASHASVGKLLEMVRQQEAKMSQLIGLCDQLNERLVDECRDRIFFALTPREAEFYNSPRAGWEKAIDRFPDTVDDVEEAFKCFALSRYLAAVFHSVQIVEVGLIELGRLIKVTDPKSGWTAVSKALDTIVQKPHKNRTRFEKQNFEFLEQVQGTVQGLKNAWRNKISHTQRRLVLLTTEFSSEIAEEIIFATRAFIRRLADGLPPGKVKGV